MVISKKDLCIVHIGMPKTGSSALQKSLFKGLTDTNVSYANFPVENHSAIIFSMFATHPETHGLHQGMQHTSEQIHSFNIKNKKLFLDGLLSTNSNTIIISGEDIFHIDKNGLIRMKTFLSQYFHKTIIVGYVRPPKSFMESAFQQLVKNHSLNRFDFSLIYPHYQLKFEKFDIVFGKENVNLWKFDPKTFPQSDITLDFCTRLNIQIDEQKVSRENDSISKEAISLLFANNKYGEKIDFGSKTLEVNNLLINTIQTIGKTKFTFSNNLIKKIFVYNQKDIMWIENRLDVKLQDNNEELHIGINSEEELLTFSPETINQLYALLGENIKRTYSLTPHDISKLVDHLKLNLARTLNIEVSHHSPKEDINMSIKNEYDKLASLPINWDTYFIDNNISNTSIDPIMHYILNWEKRNLVINNTFDTYYYLNQYDDIKRIRINPLLHYFLHGKNENRRGRKI